MTDMGVYFEPPRSHAIKTWAIMELPSRSGYRFMTEGSKAFIDSYILLTKNPTLEPVRRRIEHLRRQNEEATVGVKVNRYKEEKKQRKETSRLLTTRFCIETGSELPVPLSVARHGEKRFFVTDF